MTSDADRETETDGERVRQRETESVAMVLKIDTFSSVALQLFCSDLCHYAEEWCWTSHGQLLLLGQFNRR